MSSNNDNFIHQNSLKQKFANDRTNDIQYSTAINLFLTTYHSHINSFEFSNENYYIFRVSSFCSRKKGMFFFHLPMNWNFQRIAFISFVGQFINITLFSSSFSFFFLLSYQNRPDFRSAVHIFEWKCDCFASIFLVLFIFLLRVSLFQHCLNIWLPSMCRIIQR